MIEQFFSTYSLTKSFAIIGFNTSVWLAFFYWYIGKDWFIRLLTYNKDSSKKEKILCFYLNLLCLVNILSLWSMLICGMLGV